MEEMSEHKCASGAVRQIKKEDCLTCMRSDRYYLLKMLKRCGTFIFDISQSHSHENHTEAFDLADETHNLLRRIENDH